MTPLRALTMAAAGVGLAAAVAVTMGVPLPPLRGTRSIGEDVIAASICSARLLDGAAGAPAPAAAPPERTFDVAVPIDDDPTRSVTHRVTQGDTVTFRVTSARPGHLIVHGLTDETAVVPGQVAELSLVARYSGRFVLHFHGTDGAHFEIAALEVYPAN